MKDIFDDEFFVPGFKCEIVDEGAETRERRSPRGETKARQLAHKRLQEAGACGLCSQIREVWGSCDVGDVILVLGARGQVLCAEIVIYAEQHGDTTIVTTNEYKHHVYGRARGDVLLLTEQKALLPFLWKEEK